MFFSSIVRFVGGMIAIAGLLVLAIKLYLGLAMLVTGAVLITSRYRLMIDFKNKTYHDYAWILGLKIGGERGVFDQLEYVFIKSSKVSQTMSSRYQSTTVRREVFDAYLRFSENNKLHLLTRDSKEDLLKRTSEIAAKLGVQIVDYTKS